MKRLIILSFLIPLLFSCSSENDDEPVNKVTYTETIKTIIDENCLNCHKNPPVNGATMSLISAQNVKVAITDRDLIEKVESGYMPPVGDVLTRKEVQALIDWQKGGFQQ